MGTPSRADGSKRLKQTDEKDSQDKPDCHRHIPEGVDWAVPKSPEEPYAVTMRPGMSVTRNTAMLTDSRHQPTKKCCIAFEIETKLTKC